MPPATTKRTQVEDRYNISCCLSLSSYATTILSFTHCVLWRELGVVLALDAHSRLRVLHWRRDRGKRLSTRLAWAACGPGTAATATPFRSLLLGDAPFFLQNHANPNTFGTRTIDIKTFDILKGRNVNSTFAY